MRNSEETAMRLIATLRTIPDYPNGKSVKEIQKELRDLNADYKINVRSIQRDLDKLTRDYPISHDKRGRTHYWFWTDKEALMQIPALSEKTAFALRLADEYLRPIIPPETLKLLDKYFKQADEVLSKTELKNFSDRVAIVQTALTLNPPIVCEEVQDAVFKAVLKKRKLRLLYRGKHEKQPQEFVLSPLGIVVRAGMTYLVATAENYYDVRHYVLHRMSEVYMLREPMEDLPDFNLDKYLDDDSSFAYPLSDQTIALRVLFDSGAGAHLTECSLSQDHRTTEQTDGRILLEATVADTAQLRWWLAAFGSQAEVLEPSSLRDEFRSEATHLAKIYGADSE